VVDVAVLNGLIDELTVAARRILPRPDQAITEALDRVRFDSCTRVFWVLCLVVIFYAASFLAVIWQAGAAASYVVVVVIASILSAFELSRWVSFRRSGVDAKQIGKILRHSNRQSIALAALAGISTVAAYLDPALANRNHIPVLLTLVCLASSNCHINLPKTAIAVPVLGMTPSIFALLYAGDKLTVFLAMGMIVSMGLQIRLICEQHRRLLTSLMNEHQIRVLAMTDPLTGLPNRRAIMAMLEYEVAQAQGGNDFGVAILDLDEFKAVNDCHGHDVGDDLLKVVSARVQGHLASSDAVGRLGGDEFALLFRNVKGDSDIQARASAVLAQLCLPAMISGHRVPISASIGFAIYPKDGTALSALLHVADKALYSAKHQGKARVSGYKMHASPAEEEPKGRQFSA
jgi:diguanylate cyclase (GGDEF)-like protein